MLSSLTLDNAAGEAVTIHAVTATSKRVLTSAKGLVGIGSLRESKRVRPSAHGAINETRWEDGRLIVLEGEVASNVSVEDAISEFRALTLPMLQTLDSGPALMKWTEGNAGQKLQRLVKLDSDIEPILKEVDQRLIYQASFLAEDPIAYTQTLSTQTGATITGTAAEFTWVATSAGPIGVEVNGSNVFWCEPLKHSIGRSTLAGATITPEFVKTGMTYGPVDIAINASNLFWTNTTGIAIGRSTLAGAEINSLWKTTPTAVGWGPPYVMTVDASYIYWGSNEGGVYRMTLAGATPEILVPKLGSGGAVTAITTDATYIYYAHSNGNVIGRCKLNGAEIEGNWLVGASGVMGLAVNGSNLFWTNRDGNTIGRSTLTGTGVSQAFISGASHPLGLAVDGSHLYWGNEFIANVSRSTNLLGGPSGGGLTVAQAGNRPTSLIFKIHGPVTNPSVVRESDGACISLTGTISTGNYVEINTANRTVTLNGSQNLLSFLNAQNTNWEAFAPLGSTKYLLTASSATAAFMEILYRSGYA